jgi:hypothetical protein
LRDNQSSPATQLVKIQEPPHSTASRKNEPELRDDAQIIAPSLYVAAFDAAMSAPAPGAMLLTASPIPGATPSFSATAPVPLIGPIPADSGQRLEGIAYCGKIKREDARRLPLHAFRQSSSRTMLG